MTPSPSAARARAPRSRTGRRGRSPSEPSGRSSARSACPGGPTPAACRPRWRAACSRCSSRSPSVCSRSASQWAPSASWRRRRPDLHPQPADRRLPAGPANMRPAALLRRARPPAGGFRALQFVKRLVECREMPDPDCPVCRTADIVCGKWTLLIVRDLSEGRSRFCELERSLGGISPRTLSLRLRALEEEGIVHRATFPEVPPRVEYALTEKGRALVPIIESMRVYGSEWLGARGSCAEAPEVVAAA